MHFANNEKTKIILQCAYLIRTSIESALWVDRFPRCANYCLPTTQTTNHFDRFKILEKKGFEESLGMISETGLRF